MSLEDRVGRTLANWRWTLVFTSAFSIGSCLYEGDLFAAAISLVFAAVIYWIGLWLIVQYFTFTMKPGELIMELQGNKVREINERLADGTLEAGSEELEKLMKIAGLQPLTVMETFGPVIGRLGETEIYEWIEAKKGSGNETKRYTFVSTAEFDTDGTVVVKDQKRLYIVIDGCLYEHVPPVPETPPVPPVAGPV